ncbi:MAG: hypothetical protein RL885_10055 [Planctomycetota bacterium]
MKPHHAVWAIVPAVILLVGVTLVLMDDEEPQVRERSEFRVADLPDPNLQQLEEDRTRAPRQAETTRSEAQQPAAAPRESLTERRALEYAIGRAAARAPVPVPVPRGTPPVSSQRPPHQFLTVGSIDLIIADPNLNRSGRMLDGTQRSELFEVLATVERDIRESMRQQSQMLDEVAADLKQRGETILPDENGNPPEPSFTGELIRTVAGRSGPEYVQIDPRGFPKLESAMQAIEEKEKAGVQKVRAFFDGLR